jgi:Uma2 family endonuclease
MPLVQQKWTYAEMHEKLPPETRAEVVDNELYMSPAPSAEHQRLLKKIFRLLDGFVEAKGLGEVNIAPFDVILEEDNVVQPDLFFVATEKRNAITNGGLQGAPDLIVEILTPSSFFRDTVQKKDLYEAFGVGEYWIADPANRVIEVFTLVGEKYQLHAFLAGSGTITSARLSGLEINAQSVF